MIKRLQFIQLTRQVTRNEASDKLELNTYAVHTIHSSIRTFVRSFINSVARIHESIFHSVLSPDLVMSMAPNTFSHSHICSNFMFNLISTTYCNFYLLNYLMSKANSTLSPSYFSLMHLWFDLRNGRHVREHRQNGFYQKHSIIVCQRIKKNRFIGIMREWITWSHR